jgi:hypothetical protein
VSDEAVIGWQEEYTQALTEATKKNGGTFTLPSLSRKIELGIKHATQRMKAGDLYPPQPVRDAETTFFQQRLEVLPSTRVGDGNLGVFTTKKVPRGTTFHYHGRIFFESADIEKQATHTLAILHEQAYICADSPTFIPSFINEYIWDSNTNNVKFISKEPDNGRITVLSTILPSLELYVQYDRNENYDWSHVYAYRMMKAAESLREILKPLANATISEVLRLTEWMTYQLPTHYSQITGKKKNQSLVF